MKIKLLILPFLVSLFLTQGAFTNDIIPSSNESQVCLTATQMSIATGKPSLTLMSSESTHIPVWSLSGQTIGQSVVGLVNGFPPEFVAIKVEIVVTTTDKTTSPNFEDVYRVHLSQMDEYSSFASPQSTFEPVRTKLPDGPFYSRSIVLESYYRVKPNTPISIRIQREPGDPADSFIHPTGLAMVKVTPLKENPKPKLVENKDGYNSWSMIQSIGQKLVCVYSRGSMHTVNEDARALYARTSTDQGNTWTDETLVVNSPGYCDVAVGKGLDSTGAMLLWVRRVGPAWLHDLYRTTDGIKYELISTPKLDVTPMQITDVFEVPTVGLMSLWFAGNYNIHDTNYSWGTLTSHDNGLTWKQNVIESKLSHPQWPAEPAAVYLGDGKILAIGRTEVGDDTTKKSQFQMVSSDYGATWTRHQTNIGDVLKSTVTLILDPKTGLLSNYYYQRGPKRGILRRRMVDAHKVFHNPLSWPASEAVGTGSQVTVDAGNANATFIGDTHFVTYYSGKSPNTSVLVSVLPKKDQ